MTFWQVLITAAIVLISSVMGSYPKVRWEHHFAPVLTKRQAEASIRLMQLGSTEIVKRASFSKK